MKTKQTSIEWLIEQIENHRATFFKLNEKEERIITIAGKDIVEQAKEMEKERMIEFAFNALKIADDTMNGYVDVDKLYNETYGGKK